MCFNTKFPSLVLEHLKEDTELSYTIDDFRAMETSIYIITDLLDSTVLLTTIP